MPGKSLPVNTNNRINSNLVKDAAPGFANHSLQHCSNFSFHLQNKFLGCRQGIGNLSQIADQTIYGRQAGRRFLQ